MIRGPWPPSGMSDESSDGQREASGGSSDGADDATDESATAADRVPVEEVTHVAELARVDLDEAEAEQFASQFTDILSYFEALDEVPEVESETALTNVMRADEEREGLTQSEALANAAETEEGFFKGPRVS